MTLTYKNILAGFAVVMFAIAMVLTLPQSVAAETASSTDDATTTEDVSTTTDEVADDAADDDSDEEVSGSTLERMLATIKSLMAQVLDLQTRLTGIRSEVRETIKEGLAEGMSDEDIHKIQEVLASDPTLYPEGLVTGYYGQLTRRALERFQTRYDLEVSGELDEETRAAFETLLENRYDGKVPQGLLTAPGIMKKFEERLLKGCDNSGPGKAPFCKKIKEKYNSDDDDSEDDDDEDINEDGDSDDDEGIDDDSEDDSDDDDDDDDSEDDDDDTEEDDDDSEDEDDES